MSTCFDGKKHNADIASVLARAVEESKATLKLAVVYVGDDPLSKRYIGRKKEFGESIGVAVAVHHFPAHIEERTLLQEIATISADEMLSALIVQLPLPQNIEREHVLGSIDSTLDADALSDLPKVQSPVVRALEYVLLHNAIALRDARIAIVGTGVLVGKPVVQWAKNYTAHTENMHPDDPDLGKKLQDVDIIISGIGRAYAITPDMVREGAVLLDVGTSLRGGKLAGDIDPRAYQKSRLYTPVPGGIGPMTVAMLFANVLDLGGVRYEALAQG